MKEEKTQGIDTETTTKDRCNTNRTTKETELLDLRAGYNQHTSLSDCTASSHKLIF
jgi:hypothetical protein